MVRKIFEIFLIGLSIALLMTAIFFERGAHYAGRTLTETERLLAQSIYADAVDLGKTRVVFDTMYSFFSPVTLGNTMHFRSFDPGFTQDADLTQSPISRYAFIHELGHVYQYEHGGWSYVPRSIGVQFQAYLATGSRDGAYNWEDRVREKKLWDEWNPEEQAQAISDYSFYLETRGRGYTKNAELAKQLGCIVPVFVARFCKN